MNLLDLQRHMAADVRRPLTPDFNMQTVAEDGQSTAKRVSRYIKPSAMLTSFERLEIYNRQYWFRLISIVSEDFPVLNAVLGRRRFDGLILAYLRENPSTSWTLRNLGARLPVFLKEHPEFAARRHAFAIDVAKLEWAYVDAFDGKCLDPISPQNVRGLGPDSKLSLQPHLQLLTLNYPVDDVVLAVKKRTPETDIVSGAVSHRERRNRIKLPSIKRQRVYLAVHRMDDSVYYRRIDRRAFILLNALHSGVSIAEAVKQAFRGTKLKVEEQANTIRESFAHASELGWLCLRLPNDAGPPPLVM